MDSGLRGALFYLKNMEQYFETLKKSEKIYMCVKMCSMYIQNNYQYSFSDVVYTKTTYMWINIELSFAFFGAANLTFFVQLKKKDFLYI